MGQFKRGESGNPGGRPKGSADKRTSLREMLESNADALVHKAIEMAKDGDAVALRLCLERIFPTLRPVDRTIEIDLPAGSFRERGEVVLEAVSHGAITPSEADALMKTLSAQVRLIEVEELESRLAALEKKLGLAS